MSYHIDTGFVYENFQKDCECPLCEMEKIVEEAIVHEFLNDAVMEESMRDKVVKKGFCSHHYDMMKDRPNKLSLAIQILSRLDHITDELPVTDSLKQAKKQAELIEKLSSSCLICDFTEESMQKYYKAIPQMFVKEQQFEELFTSSKGFCMKHYGKLLKHADSAGLNAKKFLSTLTEMQAYNLERLKKDLNRLCLKHDYRNAFMPLGTAEHAIKNTREKLYGKQS